MLILVEGRLVREVRSSNTWNDEFLALDFLEVARDHTHFGDSVSLRAASLFFSCFSGWSCDHTHFGDSVSPRGSSAFFSSSFLRACPNTHPMEQHSVSFGRALLSFTHAYLGRASRTHTHIETLFLRDARSPVFLYVYHEGGFSNTHPMEQHSVSLETLSLVFHISSENRGATHPMEQHSVSRSAVFQELFSLGSLCDHTHFGDSVSSHAPQDHALTGVAQTHTQWNNTLFLLGNSQRFSRFSQRASTHTHFGDSVSMGARLEELGGINE